MRLAHAAEHKAQDDGCGVEMHVLDDDAEDTGDDHDLDADEAALRVGADGGKQQDDRPEVVVRDGEDLGEDLGNADGDDDHEDVGDDHGDEGGGQVLRLIGEEQGAHLHALEREGGGHDGCRVAAGDTEAEQRDHRAAGGGVVRGLRGGNAVDDAGAELLGVLGELVLHGVAHEGGDGGAGARQDADHGADDGAAQQDPLDAQKLLQGGHLGVDLALGAAHAVIRGEALFGVGLLQNLGHGEKTDQHGDHLHAAEQVHLAEGQTGDARHGVLAHAGQQQAEKAGDDGGEDMIGVKHHQDRKTEEGDGEEVALPEGQRRFCQRLGQEEHDQRGEEAADRGGDQRHAQGLAGFAALGHGISVKGRGRRGGHAGDLEEDRRDGAARDGRAVDRDEEDDGGHRAHRIGEGEAQGHGHGGRNAGQGAEDGAQDDGQHDHQEHGAAAPDCAKAGSKHLTQTHVSIPP